MTRERAAALGLAIALAAASGCGGGGGDDDGSSCVEVDLECDPLYEPAFEQIHQRTFLAKCALEGTACHASEGAQNGLVLEDIDTAYDTLLRSRVIPDDPACSLLIRRVRAEEPGFRMPPGQRPLSDAESCVLIQWIARGAPR